MMAVTTKAYFPLVLAVVLAPVVLQAQAPVGELFSGDASVRGSVVLAAGGTSVLSGSQVSAGQSAAVLKLQRGGELRICSGTSLSVNTSPTGDELMIGFNAGSLELHYTLAGGSDTVMTPDFRIQMIGPGTFHLALAADSNGSTCVRPLKGSEAGVIVSEILGGGSYQVAPDSAVTFVQGKITGAEKGSFAGCGCPAPPGQALPAPAVSRASPPPVSPPPEQKPPPETHLEMDTPMVYEGGSTAPVYTTSRLSAAADDRAASEMKQAAGTTDPKALVPPAASTAEPAKSPTAAPAAEKHGLFHRIGRFFSKTFGNG
ncbi:MAG: hypothetical protein ABSD96_06095 [Candidatus Korobacteraceae bacterium]